MDNQQQEFVQKMVDNIREDLREHRKETREDIAELHKEIKDVKEVVDDNKVAITRLETAMDQKDTSKGLKVLKQQTLAGFLLVFVTVIGLGISWYQISSERHHDTIVRVDENYKHIDETAEQALARARANQH